MLLKGRVWKFGDNVNTDEIIPAKYLNTIEPQELGRHCMEGIDKDFSRKTAKGDIIVAGKNFGCGSSREHAPMAIKAAGISGVIAESFARIFYRNSINIGLPILEHERVSVGINEGDFLEIDFAKGQIKDLNIDKIYSFDPFPEFIQELLRSGGLMNWIKKDLRTGR